ncbi:MAG: RNA polymerase sigma-70 factor [Bacteroidota bacterium]
MALTDQAFEDIFVSYYESLYGYAFSILNSEWSAKEIVSDVFYRLWLKKDKLTIDTSLAGYLYKSVYNACMDNIRHNKTKQIFKRDALHPSTETASNAANDLNAKDFEKNLRNALLQLPEQCRTVFQLNRMEELSYNDIAKRLSISVKTVEAHMSKALKRLRVSMAEFLTLLIVLLWH